MIERREQPSGVVGRAVAYVREEWDRLTAIAVIVLGLLALALTPGCAAPSRPTPAEARGIPLPVRPAATDGYGTDRRFGTPVQALYKASPSTLTDGEYDVLRVTSAGLLRVDGSGAASDTELPAAVLFGPAAGVSNAITAPSVTAYLSGSDGGAFRPVKVDSGGAVQVDIESIAAGNNNIGDVDVASMPADATELPAASLVNPGSISNAITAPTVTGIALFADDIGFRVPRVDSNRDVQVDLASALPAGTNNIGDVDVLTLPALVAGSALIGKVGIDQTTPGTTNRVDVGTMPADATELGAASYVGPASTANFMTVPTVAAVALFSDGNQFTPIRGDLTNGIDVDVTRLSSLVAGSAIVGKVGIDQTTPGTTDLVSVATAQGAGATIGTTSGAKVVSDANGTLQQYLRGLIFRSVPLTVSKTASHTTDTTIFQPLASREIAFVLITESAGTPAVAEVNLVLTNTIAGATLANTVGPINLAANETSDAITVTLDGANGLTLDIVSGEVTLTVGTR